MIPVCRKPTKPQAQACSWSAQANKSNQMIAQLQDTTLDAVSACLVCFRLLSSPRQLRFVQMLNEIQRPALLSGTIRPISYAVSSQFPRSKFTLLKIVNFCDKMCSAKTVQCCFLGACERSDSAAIDHLCTK